MSHETDARTQALEHLEAKGMTEADIPGERSSELDARFRRIQELEAELARVEAERDELIAQGLAALQEALEKAAALKVERDAAVARCAELAQEAEGNLERARKAEADNSYCRRGMDRAEATAAAALAQVERLREALVAGFTRYVDGRVMCIRCGAHWHGEHDPGTCEVAAALAAPEPKLITPDEVKALREEGEELAREIARRVAPMKRGPWGKP